MCVCIMEQGKFDIDKEGNIYLPGEISMSDFKQERDTEYKRLDLNWDINKNIYDKECIMNNIYFNSTEKSVRRTSMKKVVMIGIT